MHFKISFCILHYSSINIPSIFKPKRGVIIAYHGYIQANLKRASGSKTAAIVKNRDLGCPLGVLNFLNE